MMRKIHEFEEKAWNDFVYGHPNMQIAQACLENLSPHKFWSISEQHPNLVSRPTFGSILTLWANLTIKVTKFNDIDGRQISEFIAKLDRHQKALLLLGCLPLLFDAATVTMINRFIAAAVEKIYKLRAEKLQELEAPWLSH